MARGRFLIAALCSVMLFTAAVHGQSVSSYEPVEQIIGDMNPLSVSLRRLQTGLRHPVGFEGVYRADGYGDRDRLMRMHGGLRAVFPQSQYGMNRDNEIEVLIPANTVFQIGPRLPLDGTAFEQIPAEYHPPGAAESLQARQNDPRRVPAVGYSQIAVPPQERESLLPQRTQRPDDTLAIQQEVTPVVQEPLDVPGTIIGDDAYRRARLHELLERAAEGEVAGNNHAARGRSSSSF